MSLQQPIHLKSSANWFVKQRPERELGYRPDSKLQFGKLHLERSSNTGVLTESGVESDESLARDRLLYLTKCLIGHHVEVQVKDGSTYSGLFYATSADQEFGIILKMAHLTKAGSIRGPVESLAEAPPKTLIIPADELVQVIAKDVLVTGDGLASELQRGKQQEILIDSFISKSQHVELERELQPWVPDESDPHCLELENVFDSPRNRNWDQFEVNATLFGVKSSYNEELYTTKLERGPQMRELELEAKRIAREIECEETEDLHLAEERGIELQEDIDIDEETRFSSVYRGRADDSGYDEEEDIVLFSCNKATSGGSSGSIMSGSTADLYSWKTLHGAQGSKSLSSMSVKEIKDSKTEDSSLNGKKDGFDIREQSADSVPLPSSYLLSKIQGKISSPSRQLRFPSSGEIQEETRSLSSLGGPGSSATSASSISDSAIAVAASSRPGLSPSSSGGSLSSEKSTLNPYAKEFKLSPTAKSFLPSQQTPRPPSPVSDRSYYFPDGSAALHMHGLPVGPSFAGHQSVVYKPQIASLQSPPPYFHPNAHQYGQPVLYGEPGQMLYMPSYTSEIPYSR